MYIEDTIAAIATPPGEGGIAIVRLSGPDSLRIADQVFRGPGAPPSKRPSQVILHGRVVNGDEVIDEALLLIMRGPRSYTREDVVEIQCHGGDVVARRVLQTVLACGARVAEPGEFTKRAFLNGRLDLVQCEAVLDLIKAKTERAAQIAAAQLSGTLSCSLSTCYESLLRLSANIEATLDFPEDELPQGVMGDIVARLDSLRGSLEEWLSSWTEGRLLREGAVAVITGKPNVGKSAIFNALIGSERAIVSHHPGTTRDTIEEWISIDGIPLLLIDTAGIRESSCEIEQEGVRRAREAIVRANLRIHVFDLSRPFDQYDEEQISLLVPGKSTIILNKADLPIRLDLNRIPQNVASVKICATSPDAPMAVREILAELLRSQIADMPHKAAISERHHTALQKCLQSLCKANDLIASQGDSAADAAAHEIREAAECLAEILGQSYTEDLLDSIFSKFCIGK